MGTVNHGGFFSVSCREPVLSDNTHLAPRRFILEIAFFLFFPFFIFIKSCKCPSRSWLLWQGWISLAALSDRRNSGQGFNLPDLPLETGSCSVTGGAFVTLILCHLGCSPLWYCLFLAIYCCPPSLPSLHLIFPSPPLLFPSRFGHVCLPLVLHLSHVKCLSPALRLSSLPGERGGHPPPPLTVCLCYKSVLPGEAGRAHRQKHIVPSSHLFFSTGLWFACLLLHLPTSTPLRSLSSSIPPSISLSLSLSRHRSVPPAQCSRFPPSGLSGCQRYGGSFSNPLSAEAWCRKSTLVPPIIREIWRAPFP